MRNRPTRVLFVDHTSELGGAEIALRNLLRYLDPLCVHKQTLLFSDGPLAKQLSGLCQVHVLQLSARIRETRKESLGWRSVFRAREVAASLAYICRLTWRIRQMRVDIVHTNSLKSHLIGGIAARCAGCLVVWHVRDRVSNDYLPAFAVRLIRALSRIVPHAIIANSAATLEALAPAPLAQRAGMCKAFVVHDGCELPSAIVPQPAPLPVKIGLVGRISRWKGQHVFIKAAALIKDEFPDVRFEIIGSPLFSEAAYEAEIKQLASGLQLGGQLHFLGFVHDIHRAIGELQILVHASTIGEPFGQVVIEGMAAAKPVIATRGGGIPEIVEDEDTGLLVPMNDEKALADAMATLLRDPVMATQMGLRARQRVREHFTIQRTAKLVEQVYRELLWPPRGQPEQEKAVSPKGAGMEA
jgi:glycosyltransferase involved in cell wall biosynthesis